MTRVEACSSGGTPLATVNGVQGEAQAKPLENRGICAVMLHGFLGSPAHFAPLAALAEACGVQTHTISLPGHGGSLRQFLRTGRRAWEAHVASELTALRAQHEKLLLVGHSMGGLLAICAAVKMQDGIAGILAIALPLRLRITREGIRIRIAAACRARDGEDPRIAAARGLCGVSGITVWNAPLLIPNALALLCVMRRARKSLPALRVPLRVVNSIGDEIVSPRSLDFLKTVQPNAEITQLQASSHFWFSPDEWETLKALFMHALASTQ